MNKKNVHTIGMKTKETLKSVKITMKTQIDKIDLDPARKASEEVIGKIKIAYEKTISGLEALRLERIIDMIDGMNMKQLSVASGGMAGVLAITIAVGAWGMDMNTVSPNPQIEVQNLISEKEEVVSASFALAINGTPVVSLAQEADAKLAMETIKAQYQTEGAEIVELSFVETVEIVPLEKGKAVNGKIMSAQEAAEYILTGTLEPKIYAIQGGDTLWDIAAASGITTDELIAMNPGFDPAKLKIGQEINLYQVKPFVTVQLKEIVTAEERIPYETVAKSSSELYKGQSRVDIPGAYGTKAVKSEVIKQNGVLISSNVIEEAVTVEPQAQITVTGTKTVPAGSGSGTLMSPVGRIEVSSGYGSRGGSRHYGVDLRNPKGTPIVAADDGVVTCSSYQGSFGNIVKIDHGGGLVTYYAHCDTLLVNVGDKVSKGQQIATVGISGNASGYHVHFEVRLNGSPQNPMNYI